MRALVIVILFLTACNRGPQVPTATENRDLDEAGRMLDEAGDNLSAVDDNADMPAAEADPTM